MAIAIGRLGTCLRLFILRLSSKVHIGNRALANVGFCIFVFMHADGPVGVDSCDYLLTSRCSNIDVMRETEEPLVSTKQSGV